MPNLNAEQLAKQIEETLARDASDPFASRYPHNDPRVDIARRLSSANHPEMSPEMSRRIQAKVIAAHRTRARQQQRAWRPQQFMFARMAAMFAMITIVFGATA